MAALTDKGGHWELTIPKGTSGNPLLEMDWLLAAGEIYELFCRKQAGYSTKNINRLGQGGIATRIREKLDRLDTLRGKTVSETTAVTFQESVEDTWMDVADYGVIGLLKYRGDWPADGDTAAACPACGKEL